MSTLQVANIHLESTGNNRIQYSGSNTITIAAGDANVAVINSTSFNILTGNTSFTEPATFSNTITVTGNATFSNTISITEVQATAYIETVVALSGTTPTIDCDEGNIFTLTTSGDTTFTFSYAGVQLTTDDAYAFTLRVTAGGTHTLTWPASVDWAGGSAPDAPASGETDVFVFLTTDGGTNWYGFLAGDAMA